MFSSRIPGPCHEVSGQSTAEIEDCEKLCKIFKMHRSCDLETVGVFSVVNLLPLLDFSMT